MRDAPPNSALGELRPLIGKCIVITRAPEQSGELISELTARGAEVVSLPLVHFAPPEDFRPLDAAIQRLASGGFDAILFLSANAVRYVCSRCRDLGLEIASPRAPRIIAAVGPATARALEAQGLRIDYVAREQTGESLARELEASLAGRAVFLPRSDRGNTAVSAALREIGAQVTEVIAYRTLPPGHIDAALADRIGRAEIDALIFASPSAVRNFLAVFGREAIRFPSALRFVAIGPTTAQSMRDANLPVAVEAPESSARGLAEALARFYATEQ